MTLSTDEPIDAPLKIDPKVARRLILGMLGLVGVAALVYNLAKPPVEPPPPAIANDPLLVRGREIYLARCVSCHGPSGHGDGPIAKDLPGPRVRDFTDAKWRHGDRPEQVLEVVSKGVANTAMSAWAGTYDDPDLRAVSAYVFSLAGREVPKALRTP